MSLINDALRRADMEQRARDAGGAPPPPPPLPQNEDPPSAPPKRRSRWKLVLVAVLLVGGGVAALGAWWGIDTIRAKAGAAVQTASAAFHDALGRKPAKRDAATDRPADAGGDKTPTVQAAEAEKVTDADAETEPVRLAGADAPGAAAGDPAPTGTPPVPATDEGDAEDVPVAEVFGRMLSMFQAAAPPPMRAGKTPAPAGGSDGATVSTVGPADNEPAPKPEPVPTEVSPTPERAETKPAPKPAPPAPSMPLPPVNTSHIKISSIMSGSGGALAIINGRPVREGETVAGAKVLRIRSRTVEVEINGRRATVGM